MTHNDQGFASWKLHPAELRMKIEIKSDDWYLVHSCLSCPEHMHSGAIIAEAQFQSVLILQHSFVLPSCYLLY